MLFKEATIGSFWHTASPIKGNGSDQRNVQGTTAEPTDYQTALKSTVENYGKTQR